MGSKIDLSQVYHRDDRDEGHP